MKIEVIKTGLIRENCYIVSDSEGIAAVIDPGDNAQRINKVIDEKKLQVKWILVTHGHFDHVGAVLAVKKNTGAAVAIHPADMKALRAEPELLVSEGDVIHCGDLMIEVIETPGHTPGGVCYLCDDALFTGDTLFFESIGRTDLPGGNFATLRNSLVKLRDLPVHDLDIYPGHMQKTTLAHERRQNPFFEREP